MYIPWQRSSRRKATRQRRFDDQPVDREAAVTAQLWDLGDEPAQETLGALVRDDRHRHRQAQQGLQPESRIAGERFQFVAEVLVDGFAAREAMEDSLDIRSGDGPCS
jgi:hypothetical protein